MMSISRSLAGGLVLCLATVVHAIPVSAKPAAGVTLTPERMAELRQINSHVNNTIVEVSDMDQYGREDVWTLPASGRGDCEDLEVDLSQLGWRPCALSCDGGSCHSGLGQACGWRHPHAGADGRTASDQQPCEQHHRRSVRHGPVRPGGRLDPTGERPG